MTKKLKLAEYRTQWRAAGLCLDCGTSTPVMNTTRCPSCTTKHRSASKKYNNRTQAQRKAKYEQTRLEVLAHYGLACKCCGETETRFLTLDHINNDGYLHRAEMRKNLYRWAKAQGYPTTLQTLCFNCNCGKAHNGGTCPHQTSKLTLVA